MADGDITSVEIGTGGWYADITIEGLASGGTYATRLGLGENYDPSTGSPLITFTVTSLGFDDAGAATTRERTIYATKPVRKPYPDQASMEETEAGGNVTVRVALSDYIYAKDQSGTGNSGTDVSFTILSGFYTESTVENNGATGTATNSSTAAYQKVVGNWSWPGYELIPEDGLVARCVCFHRHARDGKPVACVIFEDSEGANTESVTVTEMAIDDTMEDAVPVVEYFGTPPVTSLTQGAVVTRNFRAYPWIGDDDSVLDTSDGTAAPTPLFGPQKLLCNKTGEFERSFAKVDPVNGNDTSGQVYDEATYDYGTADAFATLSEAASQIAAFNNTNYSRNNVGGGVIETVAGSYAWLGASNTYGTTPNTWITIRPGTGVTRADFIIGSASGNGDISDRIKVENATITVTTVNTFTNIAAIWFHKCDFNTTGTGLFNTTAGVGYFTQGLVRKLSQGLRPFSTNNWSPALVRGNDLTGFAHSILCYTVLGNKRTTAYAGSSTLLVSEINGMTGPYPDNCVIAYNELYGFDLSSFDMVTVGAFGGRTHGLAFVQNVLEVATSNGTPNLMFTAAGELVATNTPQDNIMVWHNTVLGARCGTAYNSSGSTVKHRRYWSWKNNFHDSYGIKSDTFNDPGEDGDRTGNWPVLYGVGSSGNIDAETDGTGTDGAFPCEVYGLKSIQLDGDTSTSDYAGFVDRQSFDGASNGSGDGDYNTDEDSPLRDFPIDLLIPYDLQGRERTGNNNDTGALTHEADIDPGGGGGSSSEGGHPRRRRRRYYEDWWALTGGVM